MDQHHKQPQHAHTKPRYLNALIAKLKARQPAIEAAQKAHKAFQKKSLVVPGPTVQGFVRVLKGTTYLDQVTNLAYRVAKIPVYNLPNKELAKVYANRSAETILKSHAIFQAPEGQSGLPIHGCVDHAHVLVACLNAMKLPATFVRWGNHSLAKFKLEGKEYFLDVDRILKKKGSPVRLIEGDELKALELLKREKLYKEGRDARDIGLDYNHFHQNQMH